jgi:hypothetical protein
VVLGHGIDGSVDEKQLWLKRNTFGKSSLIFTLISIINWIT